MFMDQGEVEVHKCAKNVQGQYPGILTNQAWSIKDLLYYGKETLAIFLQGTASNPEWAPNHSVASLCPPIQLAK